MLAWWWKCLDWFMPARCVACTSPGSWWCDPCDAKVVIIQSPGCPRCKRLTDRGTYCRACRRHVALTGILAGAHARPPLTTAVKALKYRHAHVLAPTFARYLVIALGRIRLPGRPIVVPVPLHPSRQRSRGYNQATL